MIQNCYTAWVRSWHFGDTAVSRMDFRLRGRAVV